jgi:alpha-L-fucosidase-like protein
VALGKISTNERWSAEALVREEEMVETQTHSLNRKSFLKLMMGGAAGVLSSSAGVVPSLQAAPPEPTKSLVRLLAQGMRLYGTTAAEIGSNAKLDDSKSFVVCKDSSKIRWNVSVPVEGDYNLFISCGTPTPGFRIEVFSGARSVKSELKVSRGVYRSSEEGWINAQGWINFERNRLNEKLHLTCGMNVVTLQLSGPEGDQGIHFRSLEILSNSAIAEMASAEDDAHAHRASTDWFVKAGYGVMFTWTDLTQPRQGRKKPYADAVNAFDVATFANAVDEMGAGYVIFTVNHAHPHCPAPIQDWEDVHPGWTTRRDLIGEIAEALEKRSIKFLLYIHSPVLTKLGDILPTGHYDLTFSEERFVEIHRSVLNEIGNRYGEKLAGYWFDSWFQSLTAYPDVPVEEIFRFSKVGNPNRITAFNFWVFPVPTPWQDYWAGEVYSLQNPFSSRYIEAGPGEGFQAHATLSMMPASWLHSEVGQIPPPQFSPVDLVAYVKANMEHQAVTTINIGIYQEGTIEPSSLSIMRELRKAVRG